MSIGSIKQLTDNRFLNLFNIEVNNDKMGSKFPYFVASRRKEKDLACKTKDHSKCDAVMIIPMFKNKDVVFIKQFRPAIDDYIYEFPAGLIDPNEHIAEAAVRELYEEIGLRATRLELMIKPSYTSVGISDETCAILLADVDGELTTEHNEGHEDIETVIVKMDDLNKFIDENNVSIKSGVMAKLLYHTLR